MINEAHHSFDILQALNNLVVHWSFEDRTYSKEVVRMISEGVDKSGADQVQTFLAIMRQFIAIDDEQQEYRLKQLHAPFNPEKSVLHFIKCYRSQHQPFSYQSIRALVLMMIDNATYAEYMLTKRQQWKWWDSWLDSFCHRPTYAHNRDNEKMTRDKIAFYEEKYIPLLQQHGIECQRAHNQRMGNMQSNNYLHGHVGHSTNMYGGNMNYHQRENYFQSGHQPGQFDEEQDDDVNGINAGVQRQNSRNNDLYDDDINEGGAGDAGAENINNAESVSAVLEEDDDENENDQQMEIQENDEDDDDDEDIDEILNGDDEERQIMEDV